MTTKPILELLLLVLGALLFTSASVIQTDSVSNEHREPSTDLATRTWHGPYFTWLTSEQRSELDDTLNFIDTQDENEKIKAVLRKTLKFYNNVNEERAVKATNDMQMFCQSQMTSFFGPDEMGELKNLKEAGVPTQQLFAKFNEFVAELADTDDRAQVRLYAAFCKKIFKLG